MGVATGLRPIPERGRRTRRARPTLETGTAARRHHAPYRQHHLPMTPRREGDVDWRDGCPRRTCLVGSRSCHYTMADVEPPRFVEIAADAGFVAVSLMLQLPPSRGPGFPMLSDTPMRRETKRRLDGTGVALFDAATCRRARDRDRGIPPDAGERGVSGARRFNVNGNDADEARLTDRFSSLCSLGAEYGLGAGLEFMMATHVRTLADALRSSRDPRPPMRR